MNFGFLVGLDFVFLMYKKFFFVKLIIFEEAFFKTSIEKDVLKMFRENGV